MAFVGSGPPDPAAGRANWYPDPTRRHRLRYFDGRAWTDSACDTTEVVHDPLGALPPGLLQWPAPENLMHAQRHVPKVDAPRVKMWILAALSITTFRFQVGTFTTRWPIGIAFAVACWSVTERPLAEHRRAGTSEVGLILAARWTALIFACLSVINVVFHMF
jgi:hypothetical protein